MIKIHIADDHAIVRHGLKKIVEVDGAMAVVSDAQDGGELIDAIRREMVDVVILDLSMPGRNGLEILKDLKRLYANLPVIILSMHPEDQYAVRAFRAGASGYMTKESAPEELVKAIKLVYDGGKYISPAVADLLADHIGIDGTDEPHRSVRPRIRGFHHARPR